MELQSHITTIIKGIKMVQGHSNVEMEMVYKGAIDQQKFNRTIGHIKGSENYTFYSSSSTLDITLPETKNNFRYTLYGDGAIHTYCKTNAMTQLKGGSFTLMKKIQAMKPIDINEYNTRINFKKELEQPIDLSVFNSWTQMKKVFRYKKRFSFRSSDKLFSIDLTIVKSSNKKQIEEKNTFTKKKNVNEKLRRFVVKPSNVKDFETWYEELDENAEVEIRGKKYVELTPSFTIQSSNVLKNPLEYEIEIEYLGNKSRSIKRKAEKIMEQFQSHMEFVLKAIQNNYYLTSTIQESVFRKQYKKLMGAYRFAAPQPTALELKHATRRDYADYEQLVSIRRNYCVTDKADGERNLMMVLEDGTCMMINRKNEIKNLGCKLPELPNTVFDGEYLLKDKNNKSMIMFAVFDLYIINGVDIRNHVFNRSDDQKELNNVKKSRYEYLTEVFDDIEIEKTGPLVFTLKKFYFGNVASYSKKVDDEILRLKTEIKAFDVNDAKYRDLEQYINKLSADTKIFELSKALLDKEYPYHIDGLIYTPINLPVGGSFDPSNKTKFDGRWYECFKWKPPSELTIDFKVIFKKDPENPMKDLIQYQTIGDSIMEYKTAVLYVGYDPYIHTKSNACRVINEELTFDEGYNMVPFQPYNPYIKDIEYAYIPLVNGEARSADKTIIGDHSIVEFSYNSDKNIGFWWEPTRVRNVNNPNDFLTAINNWRTLHNPLLEHMIKTGNVPLTNDSYYIRKQDRSKSPTKSLGDFHSYVKKNLIVNSAQKVKTLLDVCSGKCGDLNHWLDTKIEYVVAMDINRDNIENVNNGACNRVINAIKTNETQQKSFLKNTMLLWGDAGLNMRNGDAANDDLNRYYMNVLFGNETIVNNSKLQRLNGIAKEGFDLISCQFSIHYFFQNEGKVESFLTNISENLKSGGKFVGTAMDGNMLFEELTTETALMGTLNDEIMWKIIKKYDDEGSYKVGLPIDVYIHSIGKTTTEWLVDFDYLVKKAAEFDLKLVEVKNFKEIYDDFMTSKNEYGDARNMNPVLQTLSFFYNYFIFEKI